ncbi:hypothetical protein PoB_000328500 [Plakobranchus ocellatus]|uniref:Uncharacterized protein n=1 Tax=Plakobranchus ocellatus TaxID=259542 RepID=A0AAV3Y2A4_9GAST|nr:hypothetical protein PoB_000328500 [Plakobranchus ocellatus]
MSLPNHFLPIAPESCDDDPAHDDEKQTEDSVCGGCDDDVLNVIGNVYEVDTGVEDDHADNDNNEIDNNRMDGEEEETIKVTSNPVVLHDGDETETDDETHDSNDLMGVCFEGKAISRDNFLPVSEVLDLLTGDTLKTVHASVPLGRKENVWFLVDNSDNVIRRKGGKKSQYWDDFGAWGNGAKASTPSILYTRQNGLAIHVVKREGKYCQEKQSIGKKVYMAVEPQPASEDDFTLRRNYSKHAHSNDYVRRVMWLEEHQKKCLYEYRGKYPDAHAHGKSANPERTGAYIRLQPQVMDKLKEDVRTQKPDQLYREADVLYGPKKRRVIYDAKHRGKC